MRVKDLQELAKIIALAQDIRENSFVQPDSMERSRLGHYMCDMYSAALKATLRFTELPHNDAVVKSVAQLVYLLNSELWNDIQAWNADILKLPEGE